MKTNIHYLTQLRNMSVLPRIHAVGSMSSRVGPEGQPDEREEPIPLGMLGLLGVRVRSAASHLALTDLVDTPDGNLVPDSAPAEALHRYPLLSNFRSRSRHRRGMPSPFVEHK